jgi:flagellar biosynthesis protein FliR
MTSIFDFNAELYFLFFLVLVRLSGIFVTAPILSSGNVPRPLRLYMAVLCSLIIYSIIPPLRVELSALTAVDYLLLGIKELMIGLMLGVIPRIMFAAVDFAGTIIGFQMGLSIANVVDPQTDQQVSVIASYHTIVATLLFVVLDGHHIFFEALVISYEKVPIGGFLFTSGKLAYLLRLMGDLVIIGLKLGAPIIVSMLLANVIMGFMARSIPQMNVFIVGFPFTIGLGLMMLVIGVPYLVDALTRLIDAFTRQTLELIAIMAR